MAKVTVAIITYNRSGLLRESLQSVLNQTYQDIKVIVLDDCSSDDTEEAVKSFGDSRIRYIRNETNLTQFGNWNKAIEVCDTEYLQIFHDDDRMFPWMIETLAETLDNNPEAGIAASHMDYQYLLSNKKIPGRPARFEIKTYGKDDLIKETCKAGGCRIVAPSALLRKKHIDDAGLLFRPEASPVGDLYFWMEANGKGIAFCLIKAPLLEYRVHSSSSSSTVSARKRALAHKKVDELISSLNLDLDLRNVRTYFAKMSISVAARGLTRNKENATKQLDEINMLRKWMEDELGWPISETQLSDGITIGALGDSIIKVATKENSIMGFLGEAKQLKTLGYKVPPLRMAKWLAKYGVYQRYLTST